MSDSPEIVKDSSDTTVEISRAAAERATEIDKSSEKSPEQSPESRAEQQEKALVDANHEALMSKEVSGAEKKKGGEPTAALIGKITKQEKKKQYKKTMTAVRSQMDAPSRTFSKVIHNPAIEKTSDVVGGTVARPNAILTGSITAFVVVATTYLVAKHYGYTLSGFESIGAFLVGWLLGIIFDYFRVLLHGGITR